MAERLVVIGGDAGGMTAAATARRRRPPDELEIVVFERGPFTSYSACGIPYLVGDVVSDVDALVARSPEEHRARGVDARTGHEVLEIDVTARRVRVLEAGSGSERWEPFDELVIATGAVPVRPPLPGIDASRVFGVQTLADGVALRAVVDAEEPRHAVVVGGGYIGLEMAEALVQRGLEVSLVEAATQPMSTLDPDMGVLVAEALDGIGVRLHLGKPVEELEVRDGRVRAVVVAGQSIPADLVVLGLGVRPSGELAAAAGIEIGVTGGIVTDDGMRTATEGVWAAGDCVEVRHRVSERPAAIALGTHANKQGRVVGINVTGGHAVFPGVLGTAVTRVCDYEVGRTGLTEREAAAIGLDSASATIDGTTRAGYFPGARPIRVKVVFERPSGRMLGAQIFGREGAAKRIDVLAACLWNEMTVDAVMSMDLSYAPPFSPVWDPVLVAARKAAEQLG